MVTYTILQHLIKNSHFDGPHCDTKCMGLIYAYGLLKDCFISLTSGVTIEISLIFSLIKEKLNS